VRHWAFRLREAGWAGEEGWNVERSAYLEEIGRRGQLQLSRTHVLLVLRTRLGGDLPAELIAAIEQQTDLNKLDDWFKRSLTVSSVDEARAALDFPPE
jgi:hypothetical protein